MSVRLLKRSATRWDAYLGSDLIGRVEAVGIVERRWTPRPGADLTGREVDERGLLVTRTRKLALTLLGGAPLGEPRAMTLVAARNLFAVAMAREVLGG